MAEFSEFDGTVCVKNTRSENGLNFEHGMVNLKKNMANESSQNSTRKTQGYDTGMV